MWFTLGKLALKTGAEVYKNRKRAKLLESEAEVKHLEKVVAGEIEHKKVTIQAQQGDWKDEFCLILISIPLLLLAWSVFSDDPDIQVKLHMFFEQFNNLPFWYQTLFVGVVASIYGLKGVDIFKKK